MTAPRARLTRAAARAGVSAGGAKSGDLARAVATAALQRAETCKGGIRVEFQKPLQGSEVCGILHETCASTTVTILKLHNGGCTRIEAIELGDSQWALMRPGPDNRFECRYVSTRKMFVNQPKCPLQLDAKRNLSFFLSNKVSESDVYNEVPVEEGDILLAGSDGLWANFNEGYGILSNVQMQEKLESFFKVNYAWWASNAKHKEPFVNFVGRGMRDAVVQRMSGPLVSSKTNKRTKSEDDVTFYLGTLKLLGDEALRADSFKETPLWLFASDKVSHEKISQGVEYDSTTSKEHIESLFVPDEIKQVEDRFEGYRVEMCRNQGHCHFGEKCVFAHSKAELRCALWTRRVLCAGGCELKHGTEDAGAAHMALNQMQTYKANRNRAKFGIFGNGGR